MKKILVIESNQIIRDNIADLLELVGYNINVCANGKEGVEKAQALAPDLIICDINIPLLDGYAVLHILQKNPLTATIPFIFLTEKAEKEAIRKGMEMGADDFLAKPVGDTALLKAVETRLKKREKLQQKKQGNDVFPDHSSSHTQLVDRLKNATEEAQVYTYQTKEVIYKEKAYPHYFFFVEHGQVKTFRLNDDGKEFITSVCQKDDFFGHQAILENRPYQETAIAMCDTKLLKIPKEKINSLFLKSKTMAFELIKKLSQEITDKEKDLLHLAYDSVRKRVALKLLELIPKGDDKNNSITISRTDLASIVGTSNETMVRTISELKDIELISADHQSIRILDRKKLKYYIDLW